MFAISMSDWASLSYIRAVNVGSDSGKIHKIWMKLNSNANMWNIRAFVGFESIEVDQK